MILTKENVEEWKASLTKMMLEMHGHSGFGNNYSNEEWLDEYEGIEEIVAIEDEVQYWEE